MDLEKHFGLEVIESVLKEMGEAGQTTESKLVSLALNESTLGSKLTTRSWCTVEVSTRRFKCKKRFQVVFKS